VFIPVALVSGIVPVVVIRLVRNHRRNKLKKQLPEAFEMMARVLRAGQTISQAMRGVAEQFPSPIAEEFSLCWEQQNLGLSPEASFRELGRRTGLLEIKIFVVALSIHRQTGGNLSALLMKLSHVIRERMKLEDKVGALTAEGQMQAYVLLGLPFLVSALVYFIHPTYFEPFCWRCWRLAGCGCRESSTSISRDREGTVRCLIFRSSRDGFTTQPSCCWQLWGCWRLLSS
jgi:tight adherence protein B